MSDILYGLCMLGLLALSSYASAVADGLVSINHYRLKQLAQQGDRFAKAAYPLHMLRYQLLLNLLIIKVAANAIIILLLQQKIGSLLAVVAGSALLIVISELIPMFLLRSRAIVLAGAGAPILRRIMGVTSPVIRPLAMRLEQILESYKSVVYSKEQLIAMFQGVHTGKGDDIPADEIKMIQSMLTFGDKHIRDVMTPRRMVKVVAQEDEVGPILMDELHKSGYSRFPVIADMKHTNFVGTLYLRDLVGAKNRTTVKDIMSPHVRYVHEEESLDHALRAFLKTHHHLFVVVNNFEEFVGVLSIEDVLEEVIGKEIVDEFDQHHDLRAVAASIAEKEKKQRQARETPIKHPAKVVK